MNSNLEKSTTRSQRLHIDRRMIGILSVFAVLGIFLVVTLMTATNTLSALRGYGSMQTHWTEARKESAFQLVRYLETGNSAHFASFDSSMQLIRNSTAILEELSSNETNRADVRENLLKIHTSPDDVNKMITTFEWFHNFRDFSTAVNLWIESDRLIYQMEQLAFATRDTISPATLSPAATANLTQQVFEIDDQLTQKQYGIADALASGTTLLNNIVIGASSSLGFILLLIGGLLSFRFLKSIKKWQMLIEMNEQKFRSLFEQNPNAVFSLTKDGRFATGNKALEALTGSTIASLRGHKFEELIIPSQQKEVLLLVKKAGEGKPQAYETVLKDNSGEKKYLEITNLPIYVNGEIEGVFGIAHNITERKEAEQKIQEQLEDKTHLLSEVHDRVKNNLALMSGLIQLEQDYKEPKSPEYLDSTVSRIQSMAMVHDQLYQTESFSSIRMDRYVKQLSEIVKNSSDFNSDNYKIHLKSEPVTLSIKEAIPAGLILNELLVNAFKYAFSDRSEGNVDVRIVREEGDIILSVSDNGSGLPKDFTLENPATMGMKLITILAKQLNASLDYENKNGTAFTVRFPAENEIGRNVYQ